MAQQRPPGTTGKIPQQRTAASARPGGGDAAPADTGRGGPLLRRVRAVPPRTLLGAGGVAAAVVAAVVLLAQPAAPPAAPPAPGDGSVPIAQAWPAVRVSAAHAGNLADNTTFTPRLFVTPDLAVGMARTPDGAHLRVVLRGVDGTTTEVNRSPSADDPIFNGFTVADPRTVVYAESHSVKGEFATTIWRVDVPTGKASVVTTDTGNATFRKSAFDLVVAEGKVHWLTGGNIKYIPAELRSVPVGGGPVTRQSVPTLLSLSTWPYLTSAESALSVAAKVYHLKTRREVTVPTTPTESVKCSATWCRIGVSGPNGLSRIDVMHPDGSGRTRMAGPVGSVMNDVAVAGRFEPFSLPEDPMTGTITLRLYDLATGQVVEIARGAAVVEAQGTMLWWSIGEPGKSYTWHAADLAAVPAAPAPTASAPTASATPAAGGGTPTGPAPTDPASASPAATAGTPEPAPSS
ncbi:hypothetical protein GCM10010124_17840 [Pilimelia terevasa]|uniref:Uncharacterized protein n=1 Tax=Pilimelia terevasa TaxID=53372 RepID=A0A8J3BMT2_9ACTN|nr:hypothetical protein [Pilimelia terevasa]GGK25693.1 hypothetical protein GCM10010124_17840 [Pilimelia terevasa]